MSRLTLLSFAFIGCVSGSEAVHAPESTAAEPAPFAVVAPPEGAPQPRRCLPLMGCDRRCGDGFQQADGSWGVVRPWGDSALIDVTLERHCFGDDETQRGGAEAACMDVFVDPAACGGSSTQNVQMLHEVFGVQDLLAGQRCGFDDERRCSPI